MSTARRRLSIAAGVLLTIFAVLFLVVLGRPGQSARIDPFAETAIAPSPGARLDLRATVLDQTGRAESFETMVAGRPILFVPVQHRCPNICGVTLGGLADAVAAMPERPGSGYAIIAFGIDPHEGVAEKQEAIADWHDRDATPMDGIWATTASSEVVTAETLALGYHFKWDPELRQFAHPAAVAVLAADGRLIRWLAGLQPNPEDLSAALADARTDHVPSVLAQAAVFLCYRYDPATGRFTPSILAGFQVLGGISILALAALMLALHRRSHVRGRRP